MEENRSVGLLHDSHQRSNCIYEKKFFSKSGLYRVCKK